MAIVPDRPIRLLVSVRSATEAEAALAGGADVIDVKEPAHGALGRAADAVLTAVRDLVAGRRPVSAALGELGVEAEAPPIGFAYLKWGLAGWGGRDWQQRLIEAIQTIAAADPVCRVVPVAYADWRRAAAPSLQEVADFAREHGCAAWLLDTWGKDGWTLLDWLTAEEIVCLKRSAGMPLALAGSLGSDHIAAIQRIGPAWLAVRGAACRGGRSGCVEAARVARLVRMLAQAGNCSSTSSGASGF